MGSFSLETKHKLSNWNLKSELSVKSFHFQVVGCNSRLNSKLSARIFHFQFFCETRCSGMINSEVCLVKDTIGNMARNVNRSVNCCSVLILLEYQSVKFQM